MMSSQNVESLDKMHGTFSGGVSTLRYTMLWSQESSTVAELAARTQKMFQRSDLSKLWASMLERLDLTTGERNAFPQYIHSRTLATENRLPLVTSEALVQKLCGQYYEREYPNILRTIKERLEEIASREDNWDEMGSIKPSEESVRKTRLLLEDFVTAIIEEGYIWKAPFITSDECGSLTVEWHKGKHELHIEVSENGEEFTKVWGTNIEHEMFVGRLSNANYVSLWNWLLHG